jgi:hypothetical protein
MIITMLTLIWTGVNYMAELYTLSLKDMSQARGCAFIMATQYCEDLPDFCKVEQHEEEGEGSEATDSLAQETEKSEGESSDHTEAATNELNGELKNGLFKRIAIEASSSVERPALLGGETTKLIQEFSLPCNPKPGSFEDKMADMFKDMFGKAFSSKDKK